MSHLPRLTAATALLALALAGCSAGASGSDAGHRAVAAFYPLAWVTEQVAGDDWEVTNLTHPGTEPHDLSLDIAQTAAIERAHVVVLQGGLQPEVERSVAQNASGTPVVDAAQVVDLMPASEHEHEHEEAGHDHGDVDPHFWLDPLLMADVADAVAAELADLDAEHSTEYTARADAVRTELEALDAAYAAGLAQCERDTVVVSHEAFGYLARHGLHFEAIAGLSPDAEATPADLGRLHDLVRSEGVTTVFSERLVSSKMAETLAADLGLDTAVLDPLEGLSDETADEDYLSLMRANLVALQEANRCQ